MKYLSWLLPSKEKRALCLGSCHFCKEGFLLFLARGFKTLQFPNGRPYHEMRLCFCKDYLLNLLFCTTPQCPSARTLAGVALTMQLLLLWGQGKMQGPVMDKAQKCSFPAHVLQLVIDWDWIEGAPELFPQEALHSGTQSVSLLTNGTPKDACFWKHICLCLSLFVVRWKFDHATDVL